MITLFPPFQPKPPFVLLVTCFSLRNNQFISSLVNSHLTQALFPQWFGDTASWTQRTYSTLVFITPEQGLVCLAEFPSCCCFPLPQQILVVLKKTITPRHLPNFLCVTGTCLSTILQLGPAGSLMWRQGRASYLVGVARHGAAHERMLWPAG